MNSCATWRLNSMLWEWCLAMAFILRKPCYQVNFLGPNCPASGAHYIVRGVIDHKPNRFAKRGDPFPKAIEHLPHITHRPLNSFKIDPEEFLDADHRSHENRARHGALCENDAMRRKILPPDFIMVFGFLLLSQLEFSHRLFKCKLHGFR